VRGLTGARVEVRDLVVRRGGRLAVNHVSLTVEPGEVLVVIGPSGSGKSSLLSSINRLIEIEAGSIHIDADDARALVPHELRRRIGYCFQGLGLFPHLSVAENVAITPHLLGWDATRRAARVDAMLISVGLEPGEFRERLPRELSGGQAQRVAVARALAAAPPLLLLDEPFGALDPDTRVRLQDLLATIQRQSGVTTILVSHDLSEALLLASRIAVLVDGRLVQHAAPREIVRSPADATVQALVDAARRRATLLGDERRPA
jgi:osmoprotectant transport system ATP-binding protein